MTDRPFRGDSAPDGRADERRVPSSSGGLTGATGDLTPDEVQRDFEPGEWREASGAEHQADVTLAQASRAPAQGGGGDPGDDGGSDLGPTELAGRDSAYGTGKGLSPNDPAYRMEVRPVTPPAEERGGPEPRLGGDELREPEEHL